MDGDAGELWRDRSVPRRRGVLVVIAVGVVAAGLVVTRVAHGAAAGAVGDALYAALVYVLVALAAPRSGARLVGGVALATCLAVELAQLSGAPAAAVSAWAPLRYVLGTTFQWTDLVAYAGGVLVAAGIDGRSRRPSGREARS